MKRQQWLKHTYLKFDNLAELVRNRSRLRRIRSAHDHNGITSYRKTIANTDGLPKWHQSRRSFRDGRRKISLSEIFDVYEERSLNCSHAACSSVHTQSERYSRSSVATDIHNIILQRNEERDGSDSREKNTTTTYIAPSTSRKKSHELAEKISSDVVPSSSSSIKTTMERLNRTQIVSKNQLASENFTTLEAEEDEEDVEPNDAISVFEVTEEERGSDNTLGDIHSTLGAEVQMVAEAPPAVADEEAGGDGHHNNSVIEIEITLSSGNDTNTDDEDEPEVDETAAEDQSD